jgi:hypothetical protein
MADSDLYIADLAVRGDKRKPAIQLVYSFYWISTETWLSLGDITRDMGRLEEARSAFQSAKKAFDRLDAFSTKESLEHQRPAEFEVLRKRVRAGLPTPLLGAAR